MPTDIAHTPIAFRDALVRGDREACVAITVALLAEGYSALELYEDYFKPALHAVGSLWERNLLSVASEHLATAIVEGLMNDVFPRLMSLERRMESVVVTPVEGELHQVGARMACDLFEMHGWDAVLLTGEITIPALLQAIRIERPKMVGLSFSLHFHLTNLTRAIAAVRAVSPALPILVGGQAMTEATAAMLSATPGVLCFRDLVELHQFLRQQ